jgi:hypothetical protein
LAKPGFKDNRLLVKCRILSLTSFPSKQGWEEATMERLNVIFRYGGTGGSESEMRD